MNMLRRLGTSAVIAVILTSVIVSAAQAELLRYTALSGALSNGPPGPAGQYTLGSGTTQFSSNATATFTATADSTTVVSGTSSADTGSTPVYYNLVGTIVITITDGSTTTTFTAGTQLGTKQLAAYSMKDPGNAYSGIGFGAIDFSSPYTSADPAVVGFAYELTTGTSFYGNLLASTGTFVGPFGLSIVNGIEITSGTESGILQFFNGGSAPSFTIESVPEPATCVMALAGVACGGFSMWRRRKRA